MIVLLAIAMMVATASSACIMLYTEITETADQSADIGI